MKSILLIGMGKFGQAVGESLLSFGDEVMIADRNEEVINALAPKYANAVIAACTNVDVLRTFDVPSFDCCIVCVGDDFQSSLEITSLLKELGAKYVISRATTEIHKKFLLRNGADEVVYPEKQLAKWAAIRYSASHVLDYIELDGENAIFEVEIPTSWMGKTVGQLDIRKKYSINILGTKCGSKLDSFITPDTLLCEGKSLMVMGKYKDIQKCFRI